MKNVIASNITEYRKRLKYNQEDLAQYLNISREQISNYERGERDIPFEKLNKLSLLFGVELDELLEEDKIIRETNLSFAFRSSESKSNMNEIASFKRIVLNYIKVEGLIDDLQNQK